MITFKRDSISLSSYEADSIRGMTVSGTAARFSGLVRAP